MLLKLRDPGFVRAARRLAELTASSFSYDGASGELHFLFSGDRVSIADIEKIPWTKQSEIAASDINRCFFISFLEQATLLSGDAGEDLNTLCSHVRLLISTAPLGSKKLSIPWQPLAAARRLINILAGLSLLLDRQPSLSEREQTAFLVEQVRTLHKIVSLLREDDLGYNHLATELFAQCLYAYVFCDSELAAVSLRFIDSIERQTADDGCQLERSPTYQAHLLGHLDVLLAGEILSPILNRRARSIATRMRNALAALTHPDGGIAVFNDAAVGDGPSPAVLGAWPQTWPDGSTILGNAGYVRIQGGSLTGFFDAGACGPDDNPGHAHADFLSIELSVEGVRLIVDPGVASYKAGPERTYTRAAASHNGPALSSLEPIEFVGPFRVARRARAGLFDAKLLPAFGAPISVAGWQNGFERFGGGVCRWIGSWPDWKLTLVDVWRGRSDLKASSAFLIAAPWVICEAAPQKVRLMMPGQARQVSFLAVAGSLEWECSAMYFPYGPRRPLTASRIVLRPNDFGGGASENRFASVTIQLHESNISPTSLMENADQIAKEMLEQYISRD